MTKFVILFFTIFLIFNNVIVSSTPIKKRHGPFLPCEGIYPNQIDNFLITPNKLAYGQQVFVKFTGSRTVQTDTGAICEIAIQRDDGLSVFQTNINLCNNSVGMNCPLGLGDSQINISFPINGPTTATPATPATTANQTDTTIHKYSMSFSSKLIKMIKND